MSGRGAGRGLPFRVSIQSKLLLMLLLTSVLSAAVVGAIGFQSGRTSLRGAAFDRLTEVRGAQIRLIEAQFADVKNSLLTYSRDATTNAAMQDFARAFGELDGATLTPPQQQQLLDYYTRRFAPEVRREAGLDLDVAGVLPQSNPQRYLQALYTAPAGTDAAAIAVDDARDPSAWTAAHLRYHRYFRDIVTRSGFGDALLIDPAGNVVYSTYKGVDLGTNVLTGPYREGGWRRTFEQVMGSNTVDNVAVGDFSNYLPAHNEPTAWLMAPVGGAGHVTGVLALQFPITKINTAMTFGQRWEQAGMGSTGETYLAGPDDLMRSDSRLFLQDPDRYRREVVDAGTPPDAADAAIRLGGTTLVQPVDSEAVQRAQRGQTGTVIDVDYLGRTVLAAYAPVSLPGLQWTLVAKIDTDEAFAPVAAFTRKLLLSTVLIIFLVCLASMLLARLFVRPLNRLEEGAGRIGAGDYETTLPVVNRDEFGDLTASFNEMSRNLRVKDELLAEQRAENDRLLLSLMPRQVAERYRQGEESIAQEHRDVTVIFADIVGLDELSTELSSTDLLEVVNTLVRQFDSAAEDLGVERVRTLRSGYLASCGLNVPRIDNVRRTVDLALEMREIVERYRAETGYRLALRAGIDSGSVTSGLVGRDNVIYDMWGSAVNLAYHAQRGRRDPGIYLTAAVRDALADVREFAPAGDIAVGADGGPEPTWRLVEPS